MKDTIPRQGKFLGPRSRMRGWRQRPAEALHRLAREALFMLENAFGADHLPHQEDDSRPQVAQDRGRSSFFSLLQIARVVDRQLLESSHVFDGSATRPLWNSAPKEVAMRDQDAGGTRSAHELVRGQEERIDAFVLRAWMHIDRHVRRGCRVVETGVGAAAMKGPGNRGNVGQNAGDVGCSRKCAHFQWAIGVPAQFALKVLEVDSSLVIQPNFNHLGDRLQPRQLVGMVLVRAHEDDWTLSGRDLLAEPVFALQRLGDSNPQKSDQLVDGRGRTRTDEQHHVMGAGVHRPPDHAPRFLAQLGHDSTGRGYGRMGVGVERMQPIHPFLDQFELATGGGKVGVASNLCPNGVSIVAVLPISCCRMRPATSSKLFISLDLAPIGARLQCWP